MKILETLVKSEDGLCFFNKIFNDDKMIDKYCDNHPIYICKNCKDPFNESFVCHSYKPLRYYGK